MVTATILAAVPQSRSNSEMTPDDLTPRPRPYLPVLLALFVGSGCAALIYEVVWLQLLQLVIGSTAVSLGVLLATFMGGMCAGSLLLPRLVSLRRHPCGSMPFWNWAQPPSGSRSCLACPTPKELYTRYAVAGRASIVLRAAVAGICLLPPTLLFGATLPAIARWVDTDPQRRVMAGILLRRQYRGGRVRLPARRLLPPARVRHGHGDLRRCGAESRRRRACTGRGGRLAAGRNSRSGTAVEARARTSPRLPGPCIWQSALSGMSALGAEVVWTRLLSLLLGGTVYTFSLILAVFLVGLGIGSSLAR